MSMTFRITYVRYCSKAVQSRLRTEHRMCEDFAEAYKAAQIALTAYRHADPARRFDIVEIHCEGYRSDVDTCGAGWETYEEYKERTGAE